ncbi:hybrid sensor histidine kinase/response regulator [Acidovorax sp. SUPP3434]|uniref:ATP-binding response regulator n=1 Tax=Acidovorax sp. SUPP3434 TaxID=2920880 RepID=UPI0023DE202E|nr:hybrid sensor histidine kinase/response regulator [Acidovorax sp. SUPP3434]GKS98309.1 hybrid sensor histidine kinase/response regulator [Acidovorax sp. SUPP3434]
MKHGNQIYAERLKLVLGGVAQSLPIGFLLATLLVVVFNLTSGQSVTSVSATTGERILVATARVDNFWLTTWYFAALLARLVLVMYCRRALQQGLDSNAMRGITGRLAAGKGIEGMIWGLLGWIVVDEASSPASTAMLLGVMAAISSNAVSLLSPIRLLYVALIVPMLFVVGGRFLAMDGLMYQAMGVCCLLYVAGQYGQAGLIGRGLSDSICLRFENLDLIKRLEVEKRAADEAKERAEQANQAKSRFLAAASHDLRQPVHALGLFLEALSCGPAGVSQRSVVDHAKAASAASREMLDTLLDFSRIEAGVIQPHLSACRIQPMLYKLEQELAPLADAKGLIYRSRESGSVVTTDMALLEMILRNLISNAVRYTERGGVLIGCRRRGSRLLIEVFDTGIGIAPEQQREIFQEFHQLGNPERDRRKGLGLGLAIADGLSRSLDHPLTLHSKPGRGSVFRISIPLAPSDAGVSAPDWPQPKHGAVLAGRRILVIDDDEAVRMAMHTLLQSYGCIDRMAESLQGAMALGDWVPDAIVCDYRLGDRQTGPEVIRQLRIHYARPVPALLVTGDTAPDRLREAVSSDIALLHKPVAPDKFWSALSQMLANN